MPMEVLGSALPVCSNKSRPGCRSPKHRRLPPAALDAVADGAGGPETRVALWPVGSGALPPAPLLRRLPRSICHAKKLWVSRMLAVGTGESSGWQFVALQEARDDH